MWSMWVMSQMGSLMAGGMVFMAIIQQLFQQELGNQISRYFAKLVVYFNPFIEITFHEYQGEDFTPSTTYSAIQRYLTTHSSNRARRLKAIDVQDCKSSVVLSMDDHEEITDKFKGVKVWWCSKKITPPKPSYYSDDNRLYKLTCHKKHRDFITNVYLQHVIAQGKAIAANTRRRKLYTNIKTEDNYGNITPWKHIIFEHPSTFDTLAMDLQKKKAILNDLMTFSKSKDYYRKIGKAWKRGYLLYGPPGTGKSSMIAAMSNFLNYDIYDIELASVNSNTSLRKLLIDTSSKSIIVIEDIDCSLDLTGQRKKEQERVNNDDDHNKKKKSEVTLSGLLNFIDGLWSACGSERLIVFTSNYVEKLDPALIRRGRMDMHIEMSYCCYESFKVLAKNYLEIESHELFADIGRLLKETDMSPADVAENLMPKSPEENAEYCLNSLIKALENAKDKQQRLKVIDQEGHDCNMKSDETDAKLANAEGDDHKAGKDDDDDDDDDDGESSDGESNDEESSDEESSDE